MDAYVLPGMRVLDLGTGTGILALSAAKLGAGHVTAVDTDENAITAARRNIQHNGAQDCIDLRLGSLADVEGTYDLILANILAPIIISMVESGLAARLHPGGLLVVSGILIEQMEDVQAALDSHGLVVSGSQQKDDWVALSARLKTSTLV